MEIENDNENIKDKKVYELALLLKSEDDLNTVLGYVQLHKGEMTNEPRAKKLALAYKIKNHTEAIFVSVMFRAVPTDAKALEDELNTKTAIIRFLILIAPTTVDRPITATPFTPQKRGGRPMGSSRPMSSSSAPSSESKSPASRPLSNEDLGKKIEEILQ